MQTSFLDSLFLDATPLLDVRAPVEFARGAFPGATNLPLLNDAEREQVGTCYKQHGQQSAIELGEKLISGDLREQRIHHWLDFARQYPHGHLYCFRGGLRSRTTQRWLSEKGVDYPLIEGGYKRLRQHLIEVLNRCSDELPWLILGGRTGSGKTWLLPDLGEHIDLEALAHHRGSSFGGTTHQQPGNIDFENRLAIEMLKLERRSHGSSSDNSPLPIVLEDEGRMIGRVCMPEPLREAMQQAPIVLLEVPLAQRVAVSTQDYIVDLLASYRTRFGDAKGLDAFRQHHHQALARIRKRFGRERQVATQQLFDQALTSWVQERDPDPALFENYVSVLLSQYYDPMYDYQLQSKQHRIVFRGAPDAVREWVHSASARQHF